MSVQLADKLTPVAPEVAIKALAEAYRRVTGRKPSKKIFNLLVGQSSVETGNWQLMHNFEMGNAKSKSSDPFFQVYGTHDDPTDPGAHYAAHQTLDEGAEHYIQVLKGRDHWWKALQSGSPPKFIAGLSTQPVYFTANPATYLNTLNNRITKYAPIAKQYAGSTVLQVLGGIALGLATVAGYNAYQKRKV